MVLWLYNIWKEGWLWTCSSSLCCLRSLCCCCTSNCLFLNTSESPSSEIARRSWTEAKKRRRDSQTHPPCVEVEGHFNVIQELFHLVGLTQIPQMTWFNTIYTKTARKSVTLCPVNDRWDEIEPAPHLQFNSSVSRHYSALSVSQYIAPHCTLRYILMVTIQPKIFYKIRTWLL